MKTQSITIITTVAALLLSAGAVLASEDVAQGNRVASTTRQAPQSVKGVELEQHPTPGEAAAAGYLREQRVLRWMREMRAQRALQSFFCDSGPAVQAALKVFWGIEAECREAPTIAVPTCRYASRVANPC